MADTTGRASGGVLVVAPMLLELRAVAKALSLERWDGAALGASSGEPESSPGRVARRALRYRGGTAQSPVSAALGGIGFAASAGVVEELLDLYEFDRVVVCGIAGGVAPGIGIGDVVIPERVIDLTTDAEYRPVPMPAGPDPVGTIVCSDELVVGDEAVDQLVQEGYTAIDMETAAVAAVCEQRGCRWSVVRSVSDLVSDSFLDESVLALTGADGSIKPAAAARFVVAHPTRIPQLVGLGRGASRAARVAAATLASALAGGGRR